MSEQEQERRPLIPGGSLWTPEMDEAMRRRGRTEDDAEDEEFFAQSSWAHDTREEW